MSFCRNKRGTDGQSAAGSDHVTSLSKEGGMLSFSIRMRRLQKPVAERFGWNHWVLEV